MGNLETIVFDFDGTLADTLHVIVGIARELTRKYNLKVPTDEEVESFRGMHAKKVRKIIFGRFNSWLLFPKLFIEGLEMFYHKRDAIQPHNGIVDVVKGLSQEYNILVVSSNKKETIHSMLHRWDLRCNGVYHSIKLFGKHHEIRYIMKERGWKPSDGKLLYVGDEARDVHACQAVGIEMIGVTWGLNNEEALLHAGLDKKYLIRKPYELPQKIEEVQLL